MTLQAELLWLKSAASRYQDATQAERALNLVASGPPYAELFFSKLSDSAWLPILERNGYFLQHPVQETSNDLQKLASNSLPFIALSRFSKSHPEHVTAILLRTPLVVARKQTDLILRCIASLRDPKYITSVKPLALHLAETTHERLSIWIDDILRGWMSCGAIAEATSLLRSFVAAATRLQFDDPHTFHNCYSLIQIDREAVEAMAQTRPREVIEVYFDALSRWAALRRPAALIAPAEYAIEITSNDPAFDRPATDWLQDFHGFNLDLIEWEGTLALRLFSACAAVVRTKCAEDILSMDSLLRSDRWSLFARLRWQLYADYPDCTLSLARRDVLEVASDLGRYARKHCFEFAQLLMQHANTHGTAFLSPAEVDNIVRTVLAGPIDEHGAPIDIPDRHSFWRKQLQPIQTLLPDSYRQQLAIVNVPDREDYKVATWSEGELGELISPISPQQLIEKTDEELWGFVNNWLPQTLGTSEKRDSRESIESLATTFSTTVELFPHRFRPESKWWQRLRRPLMFQRMLDRATDRVAGTAADAPTISDQEWQNWIGLVEWVTSQVSAPSMHLPTVDSDRDPSWSNLSAARLLSAMVNSEDSVPSELRSEVSKLLRRIVDAPDHRLDGVENVMGDWLTTAINSARGVAMQALFDAAIRDSQAQRPIQPWLFETILGRLIQPKESPAIYALVGSRLRLLVFLFAAELRKHPDLIFPKSRPSSLDAAVAAHFQYDRPAADVIHLFPELVPFALGLLRKFNESSTESIQSTRDFAVRLGTHIAFYYWNSSFDSSSMANATLDAFFALAPPKARASVVEQIGSTFAKAPREKVSSDVSAGVMRIWERRLSFISAALNQADSSPLDFQGELAAFTGWIRCECFPIEWRVQHVMGILSYLKLNTRPHHLLRFLGAQKDNPERLLDMLRILEVLARNLNDEVRWSIQENEIRPLLDKGISAVNEDLRIQAQKTLNQLLKQGFLDFVDVGQPLDSTASK